MPDTDSGAEEELKDVIWVCSTRPNVTPRLESSVLILLILSGGHTQLYSGSFLVGSGDHIGCQRLNPGWTRARQASYLLYYRSGPVLIFYPKFRFITFPTVQCTAFFPGKSTISVTPKASSQLFQFCFPSLPLLVQLTDTQTPKPL